MQPRTVSLRTFLVVVGILTLAFVVGLARIGRIQITSATVEATPAQIQPQEITYITQEESPDHPDQELLSRIYEGATDSVVSILSRRPSSGSTNPAQPQGGQGSGWVWDDEGHIVTNNHVVDDATEIIVNFSNGMWAEAELVARDPQSDLAVLRVEAPEGISLRPLERAAALFHLVAHGAAKAMLFLGAGSVMHAMHEETDIRNMGGLRRRMPITGWTFVIGAASLAGVIPLAGFFTKDEVLLRVLEHRHPIFIVVALVGVLLSALYMARLTFYTFFGEPRSDHNEVHESPRVMTLPLLLLAVPAVGVGLLAFGFGDGFNGFATFIDGHGKFHLNVWLSVISLVLAGVGLWIGWVAYVRGTISTEKVISRLPTVHRVLAAKYYVDELYQWVIDRIVLVLGRLVATFDRVVVNDTAVDGSADSVKSSGFRIKFMQTGRIYNYGMAMAAGVIALSLIWWIIQT